MGEFYKEEMFKRPQAASQAAQGVPMILKLIGIIVVVAIIGFVGWWKITHNPSTMIVDINHASAAELSYLPGIGDKTAEGIIKNRPYKTIEDLEKVHGIGKKTIEKIKPRVKVVE
jgi:competence protein ComEA